jgi:hypothetical protein
MRLADDFAAIARRLREIKGERERLALPAGVRIIIWESWENSRLTAREVAETDLCLMLRQQLLMLVKSRTGTFITRGGIDMFALLKHRFPSARMNTDRQILLSEEEANQLRTLVDHTPW